MVITDEERQAKIDALTSKYYKLLGRARSTENKWLAAWCEKKANELLSVFDDVEGTNVQNKD